MNNPLFCGLGMIALGIFLLNSCKKSKYKGSKDFGLNFKGLTSGIIAIVGGIWCLIYCAFME